MGKILYIRWGFLEKTKEGVGVITVLDWRQGKSLSRELKVRVLHGGGDSTEQRKRVPAPNGDAPGVLKDQQGGQAERSRASVTLAGRPEQTGL